MITDWLDPVSYKLGQAAGGGGGGGNPNYVETIEGTLANPWGKVDYGLLLIDIASNNATAIITVPALSFFSSYLNVSSNHLIANGARFNIGEPSLLSAGLASYGGDGTLNSLLMWQNGTTVDVTSTMSGYETTLTIIHHPLP